MTTKIELSDSVWRQAAVLAYAGYTLKGRGAIILDVLSLVSPSPGQKVEGQYLSLDELKAQDWMLPEALAGIESYDPETQIVVLGRKLDGGLRTSTVSADDAPSPRELYDQFAADLQKKREQDSKQ